MKVAVLLHRLCAEPGKPDGPEILGAFDRAALAAGRALLANTPGTELLAIAAGSAASEGPALALALTLGATDALHIDAPALETTDYLGITHAIAGALRGAGYDLVLAGDRADDDPQAALGPAVAEALGLLHLGGVVSLRSDSPTSVIATRRASASLATWRLELPVLLCIATAPESTVAFAAQSTPVDARPLPSDIRTVSLADLGLSLHELGRRAHLRGEVAPTPTHQPVVFMQSPGELAAWLRAQAEAGV